MFRNQYDTDVTTWSPAGRLHQVEYAMEAVKQGGAAVGLRSKTHAVLATLKRASSELSSYQRKIFEVDEHLGVAIAGLVADGRVLSRYMRGECINHRFVYESPFPVGRLALQVADKCQVCTHRSWKRPYGVGLLVAGYDETGPHLFQTCPSGNYWEFHAMAIGSRSQAAKTYLERKFETFDTCTREELIRHALFAVKESLQEGELNGRNCSVAVVGEGEKFTILEDEALQPYIDALEAEEGGDDELPPAPPSVEDAGATETAVAAEPPKAGAVEDSAAPVPPAEGTDEMEKEGVEKGADKEEKEEEEEEGKDADEGPTPMES